MVAALRLLSLGGVTLLLSSTAVLLAAPTEAQAAGPDAVIRAAHLSPTTPGVDVYLSPFAGAKATHAWLSNVGYGQVSNYQALTPGLYTVAMRPAGAKASTAPVLTWTLNAHSGSAYTVAGVGAGASVRGVVITDSLSAPPSGQGRVRVIQAASRAPVAEVTATTGAVIAKQARFASVSGYATLPAGVWKVRAVSTSKPSLNTTSSVDVRSGQITSILVLDSKSAGITLRTLVDSAGSSVTPIDAVPAGGGGMATVIINQPGRTRIPFVAGGLVALLAMAGVSWRRHVVGLRRELHDCA